MLKEIKEERKGKSNGGDESFDNIVSAYALAKSSLVMVSMKVAMFVKRGLGDGKDDSIDEIYIYTYIQFLIYKILQ